MDFSDALNLLKSGKRVSRQIAKKETWVQIIDEESKPKNLILCNLKPTYLADGFMLSEHGFYYVFWQVSFDDLMARDWFEVQ